MDLTIEVFFYYTSMDLTDRAIGQFRKRLTTVIAAKSVHTEQHFDYCFRSCRYVVEIFSISVVCMLYATKYKSSASAEVADRNVTWYVL